MQADTIIPDVYDPQSMNRYSYVRNNPLKYTDPLGLSYQICDANGQNCTTKKEELSDAEFEAEKKKAQASGEYFKGGKQINTGQPRAAQATLYSAGGTE